MSVSRNDSAPTLGLSLPLASSSFRAWSRLNDSSVDESLLASLSRSSIAKCRTTRGWIVSGDENRLPGRLSGVVALFVPRRFEGVEGPARGARSASSGSKSSDSSSSSLAAISASLLSGSRGEGPKGGELRGESPASGALGDPAASSCGMENDLGGVGVAAPRGLSAAVLSRSGVDGRSVGAGAGSRPK